MAVVPSIDASQSSFFKHHATLRLQFVRCGSFIPSNFSSINPQRKTNFSLRRKNNNKLISQYKLHNWDETHQSNRPKLCPTASNYRNCGNVSTSNSEENIFSSNGGSTMDKIVEKLKKFGYVDDVNEKEKAHDKVIEKGSIEDMFYQEQGLLPNSRDGFSKRSKNGEGNLFLSDGEVRFPWEKPAEKKEKLVRGRRSHTSLAELTLPEPELRRLRNLALRMKNKTTIGGSGVTQQVVDVVREKWKLSEIVKLKVEGAPALNMKRVHEILERKTGGLVIWRSGASLALYRGVSYDVSSERPTKRVYKRNEIPLVSSSSTTHNPSTDSSELAPTNNVHLPQVHSIDNIEEKKSLLEVKYEEEIDNLLDGLGPRYTDWTGCDPLPVDADLLPGVIPNYRPPFRLRPYGIRSSLGTKEATALRRVAAVLPPHFALGRSRQHQGLAEAMVKLWEKSSIVKIALKRGVQLTTSERMAEDIKKLTGGVLVCRTKEFLVFFRGNNFLPPDVAEALLEKEITAKTLQDEEEKARFLAAKLVTPSIEKPGDEEAAVGTAGTLGETLDANARWGKQLDNHEKAKVMKEAEVARHANVVRKLDKKLAFAERRLTKAEQVLSKVEAFLNPAENQADPQSITDEERFMFRKLGLRMKAFLLLGRRGVFDGTIENMHLHWKYRELVKIMVKAKNFDQVKNIALSLEAESGGVLVSVDKVSKGYAIVVFRGKDYERPSGLRPKNLLTKRKALARSIEIQRREALLNHVSTLQTRIRTLKDEIEQMDRVRDVGDDELYDKLEFAYSSDEDESEEDGDEASLEPYGDDDSDFEDLKEDSIHNNLPLGFQYQDSDNESNDPYLPDETVDENTEMKL